MIQLGTRSRTKNPTATPSVVRNPTPTPPKNLRLSNPETKHDQACACSLLSQLLAQAKRSTNLHCAELKFLLTTTIEIKTRKICCTFGFVQLTTMISIPYSSLTEAQLYYLFLRSKISATGTHVSNACSVFVVGVGLSSSVAGCFDERRKIVLDQLRPTQTAY